MTVRHATPGFLAGPVLALFTCLLSVAAAAQTGQQPTKPSASDIADQQSNPNAIWRQFPYSGPWLVGTLAGLQLLAAGMTTVTMAGAARKLTAHA